MEVTLSAFRKRFTYDSQKDLLGNGGFSQVYKAYDNEDKIFVALKIYQGDPVSKYNLINEVKRFKKLRHPNIVEHIEAYEVNTGAQDIHGNPVQYQVGILEYADGGTLADLLKKGKPDYRLLEELTKDIIEGLVYLHSNNIIHRDLKPSNILLFNQGGKFSAKITDFGIAKITDATAASTQLVGTVEYMAPEFFKTDSAGITPAADLWSLGVILLEALTGTHPFGKTGTRSTSEQIIHNILFVNPTEAQNFISLSEPFKSIITNCLRREPYLRPTTAADLKHYFDAKPQDIFGEKTQVITIPKREPIVNSKFRTKKVLLLSFLLLLVIIITIGAWFIFNSKAYKNRQVVKEKNDSIAEMPLDRWVYMGDNYYNEPNYFDSQSIIVNDGIVTVTIKEEPPKNIDLKDYRDTLIAHRKSYGGKIVGFEDYAYTLRVEEINCSKRKKRITHLYYFNTSGKIIEHVDGSNAEWSNIIPETYGETLIAKICSYANSSGSFLQTKIKGDDNQDSHEETDRSNSNSVRSKGFGVNERIVEPKETTATPRKSSKETWVKETLESYPSIYFDGGTNREENMRVNVSFSDCDIIIENETQFGSKITTTIPLKEIYVPLYTDRPKNAWADHVGLIFKIKSSQSLIQSDDYYEGQLTSKYESDFLLLLPKQCVNENIPDRLIKAFKNLIQYCGGSSSSDSY